MDMFRGGNRPERMVAGAEKRQEAY